MTRPDGPVAVVNVISGPSRLEVWIRGAFRATLATLDGVAGLEQFGLVRVVGSGSGVVFASITAWTDLRAFEQWRTGPEFAAAHPDRGTYSNEFTELCSVRVDFPVSAQLRGADLTAEIMGRLHAARPDIAPADAQLVQDLQWPDDQSRSPAPRTGCLPCLGRCLDRKSRSIGTDGAGNQSEHAIRSRTRWTSR